MNWKKLADKLHSIRIPLAVLALGLVLLLLTGKGETAESKPSEPDPPDTLQVSEQRLQVVLESIDGVGRAQVLLSYASSAETEYVTNESDAVIVSAGSGKQEGLVRKTRYPDYLGAVIVCDGGDQPAIQYDVTQATARFTGLSSDHITVLKRRN